MYVIVGEKNSNNDKFGVYCGFNGSAFENSKNELDAIEFESDFKSKEEIRVDIFTQRRFAKDECELIREKIDIPMKIIPLEEWLETIKNSKR